MREAAIDNRNRDYDLQDDSARTFRLSEVMLVTALGVGQLVLVYLLHMQALFVTSACLAWALFVAIRSRDADTRRRWGLRRDTFLPAMKAVAPLLLAWTLASVIIAWRHDVHPPMLHFTLVLLLYPVWGMAQQHAVAVMLAGNLNALTRGLWSRTSIVALSAGLFALAHLPEPGLAAPAFLLGLASIGIFLRWRNLWAIGLFHGWFATLLYYLVLARDPLQEMLARFAG